MCKRFNLNVYGKAFTECFLHFSRYVNGTLQVSVFGINPDTNMSEHFLDISLEQNAISLLENEIILDYCYKSEIIEQLENEGILKERVRSCAIGYTIYPIYSLDIPRLENYSYMEEKMLSIAWKKGWKNYE